MCAVRIEISLAIASSRCSIWHLYIYALVPDILAWQKLTLVRLSPGHSAAEVRNFKVGIMSGTQGTDVSTSNDLRDSFLMFWLAKRVMDRGD